MIELRGNPSETMTKLFYIVDHYVPFPSSEYGGIWNVIAQDDNECFDLITSADEGDFNRQVNTMHIFVKTFLTHELMFFQKTLTPKS